MILLTIPCKITSMKTRCTHLLWIVLILFPNGLSSVSADPHPYPRYDYDRNIEEGYVTLSNPNTIDFNDRRSLRGDKKSKSIKSKSIKSNGESSNDSDSDSANESDWSTCLNFKDDSVLDNLISNANKILITMPPKAAGTSLRFFSDRCMGIKFKDHVRLGAHTVEEDLKRTPDVVSNHIAGECHDKVLVEIIRKAKAYKNMLQIRVYREEIDRMRSGILQVFSERICNPNGELIKQYGRRGKQLLADLNVARDYEDYTCRVDEGPMVEKVIHPRMNEIKGGSPDALSCHLYDSLQNDAPNFVFVHISQVDKLQKIISKHYCPDLMDAPMQVNFGKTKTFKVIVRLKSKGGDDIGDGDGDGGEVEMSLDDWLDGNEEVWQKTMNENLSCPEKTVQLQMDLDYCPSHIVKVNNGYYFEDEEVE